ncbi:MAG: T9SS type A sorting domain-containing protein [Bacteroidetes bacterium]|nr:T9SS type A sorting domain-containing protein [Bacteroidota bacterium]
MTPPGYVNATDQDKLINYLENGGNLYIESVNIGLDYENTTFFDYLGIEFLDDGDEYEVMTLKGGCYNCTESLKFDYLGDISPHYSCDKLGSNGAALLLNSEDGKGRMFVNEQSNYKVISSSVVIAAIANDDSLSLKPYLFSEFVNYFMGYNPVTALQENIFERLEGYSFPNPFANETTINFTIGQAKKVKIAVYTMNGQLIKNLVHRNYKPGEYNVIWDATDLSGNKVDNGWYLCKIVSGNQILTKKMVVVH